jgi:hypothetical protein
MRATVLILVITPFVVATLVALLAAVRMVRQRNIVYTGPRPSPEEVAYLAGGRARAVQSALASLWIAADVHLRPIHEIPGASALQRAVAAELALGRTGRAIVASPAVGVALDGIRNSLQRKGLLTPIERRTPLGRALLRQHRQEYAYLAPAQRPAWTTYGPAAAGLGVGLYGTAAFLAISPRLAAHFPVRVMTVRRPASGARASPGDEVGRAACP